jgi:hypothetical protein
MATTTKTDAVARAQLLIAGTKKHFTSASPLAFASASYTPAQVEASLQTFIDLRSGVDAAKAETKTKLAAEAAQSSTLRTFMSAFESFVRSAFSNSPDVLADFGLKPRKARTQLTVEQKAAADAKRKATREARNVMGSKQRLAVKGDVTGVIVTPVKAAAAPAPSTSPAAHPAGTTGGTTPHTA